jgi:hypothetical protein
MEELVFAVLVISAVAAAFVANRNWARPVSVLPIPSCLLISSQPTRPVRVANSAVMLFHRTAASSKIGFEPSTQIPNQASADRSPITISTSHPVVVGPRASDPAITVQPNTPILVTPPEAIRVNPTVLVAPAEPVRISAPPSIFIRPSPVPDVTIGPARTVSIEPPRRGAWDERGWTRRTNNGQEIYEGSYQVIERRTRRTRSFEGRIAVNRGQVTAYISNPPGEIKKHRHGPCFQLHRAPWFQLHWRRPAQNPDEAILYMERVLDESLND